MAKLDKKNTVEEAVRSIRSRSSRAGDRESVVSSKKPKTEVFSEINENDEWTAIQKFNTLLYYEEQKQAMMREQERKRLMQEELAAQVQNKKMKEQEMSKELQAYEKMA